MPDLKRKDSRRRTKTKSGSRLASLASSLDPSPSPSGASTPARQPTKDRSAPSRTATLLSSVTNFLTPGSTPPHRQTSSSSSSSGNDNSYASARSSLDNGPSFSALARSKPAALPPHHLPNNAGFRNPWPSAQAPGWQDFVQFPLTVARHPDPDTDPTKTIDPDWSKYDDGKASEDIIATWLGHAGVIVQLPFDPAHQNTTTIHRRRPIRLLFDPIFSLRAGPSQWTGPKRFIPSPCQASDLPTIDFCFISHSHYDHLDLNTILDLHKAQPHVRYFVPLALKSWFSTLPIPGPQVVELDWWEDVLIPSSILSLSAVHHPSAQRRPSSSSLQRSASKEEKVRVVEATAWEIREAHKAGEELKITFVPAQHKSGRTALDQDTTLWGGWIVEQFGPSTAAGPAPASGPVPTSTEANVRKACVYHAGDTGYRSTHDPKVTCPIFKEIGDKFGPIDFSMIPIWRGGSLSFLAWAGLKLTHAHLLHTTHVSPSDAVRLHLDVRSRHTMGVHHGCFVGSEAESVEPLVLLRDAREDAEEGEGSFADDDAEENVGEGKGQVREPGGSKARPKVEGRVEDEGGFGCVDAGETVVVRPEPKGNAQ